MTEMGVNQEELSAARAGVRLVLGQQLESKATDAFCIATYRRSSGRTTSVGLEALTVQGAVPPIASVVEFGEAETPRLPKVTERPDWLHLRGTVEALGPEAPADMPIRATAVLRLALVATTRNASYQVLSPVYDEIERLSGSLLRPGQEVLGAPPILTPTTQVCWLNRTLRTWAGPETLAEVAAAKEVHSVDIPRRLMPDSDARNHLAIGFPAFAQQTGLAGEGITVAVVDTEVSLGHPALAGRVVHRRNYTQEPWGNPSSHGTAVAGIIAADDPNNRGLASRAVIYNYKVLATNRMLNGDDFGGAIAIQHALEDNVEIANCSWGAGPATKTPSRVARAVDSAWALGLTIVKSAGNAGPGLSTMTAPAEAQGIVVVGATDIDGQDVADYSSRGPVGSKLGPDVVAPGGTYALGIDCCLVNGGFGYVDVGTSFAAPHVSGLLALTLQQDPHLVPDQLRDRLRKNARALAAYGPEAQGHGLAYFV